MISGHLMKFTFNNMVRAVVMWIPPEVKEPVLMHHPTRASIGYYGAVRLRDGKFAYGE